MAIDPSIILQARGIDIPDFAAIRQKNQQIEAQKMQMQMQGAEMQQKQAAQQRQMMVGDLFKEYSASGQLDQKGFMSALSKAGYGQEAMEFGQKFGQQQYQQKQIDNIDFDNEIKRKQYGLQSRQAGLDEQKLGLEYAKLSKEKAPTSDQYKAGSFAQRMAESEKIMDGLAKDGFDGTDRRTWAQKNLFNEAKPVKLQQMEQTQRNFITALLRRESGAAIADSEFEMARQQYFPQAGDAPEVLEQKRQNRIAAGAGIRAEAGSAFDLVGQERQRQMQAPSPYQTALSEPRPKTWMDNVSELGAPKANASTRKGPTPDFNKMTDAELEAQYKRLQKGK